MILVFCFFAFTAANALEHTNVRAEVQAPRTVIQNLMKSGKKELARSLDRTAVTLLAPHCSLAHAWDNEISMPDFLSVLNYCAERDIPRER